MITKKEVLNIVETRIKNKLAKEKDVADNFKYDHFLNKLSDGIRLAANNGEYGYNFPIHPAPKAGFYEKDVVNEIIRRVEEAGFGVRLANFKKLPEAMYEIHW